MSPSLGEEENHEVRGAAVTDSQVAPYVEATQGADLEQVEQAGANIAIYPERMSTLYDMISGWQLAVQSDLAHADFGVLLSTMVIGNSNSN